MKFIKQALMALLLCLSIAGIAQATTATYNIIETAYNQTTISQSVVFDSTMQAGGTFTFSVLAHNGGGRAGQSDTANVSITFYNSSGQVISSVATNYTNNLPQPTASGSVDTLGILLSGNPQADPAVPWTTLSISSTNCGGSCANVAYAVVSMTGIDGSYYAGDYGPWYQLPVFTLNNGGNLLYNPEFGPYNGTQVQGWTSTYPWGTCQGAYGGSNSCVLDNSGITANQNSPSGPSVTGGTTSGAAGGYNSTLTQAAYNPASFGGTTVTTTSSTYSSAAAGTTVTTDTLATGTFTGDGGTLQFVSGATTVSNDITLTSNGLTVDQNSQNGTLSGNISGSGGLTISNSGTGGSVTLSGTETYTGATVIDSGATLINNTNITSSSGITNAGTFVNNGVAGTVTDNTGTITNSGTLGNITNHGTITNSGTTGSVRNFGTFTNTGTTGSFQNAGVLNNNTGGVVASLDYNNYLVNNHGTITTVTYNGNTVNNYSDGVIGSINNTQPWGRFNNLGTVTGTVTTPSTFNNSGTVIGLFTNSGNMTNNTGATTGDMINNGAVTNNGTMGNITNNLGFANNGTVGTVNNTSTFYNSGSTGAVTNTAGFIVTGAGTSTSMTNSGIYNITGTVNPTTNLNSYTQTSTGSTILNGQQKIAVNGPATLAGTLQILNSPTALGKYTFISADSITGEFNTVLTDTGVVRYTSTGVQLWVMPGSTLVQSEVNSLAANLSEMNSVATSALTGALGSDCAVFGKDGVCVSFNYSQGHAASGDVNTAGVTVAKQINAHWHAGVYTSQLTNNPSLNGTVFAQNSPAWGGFVAWNKNSDHTGLGVSASAITGTGSYAIGNNPAGVNSSAYQIESTYMIPLTAKTSVTPYAGIRHTDFAVNGYTEQGVLFPLTYADVGQHTTDLLAGAGISHGFTDRLSAVFTAGVIQNLSNSVGTLSATSDMGVYNSVLQGGGYTAASLGAGVNYAVTKYQSIGLNAGWQQRGLYNANIGSVGVSYTVGF